MYHQLELCAIVNKILILELLTRALKVGGLVLSLILKTQRHSNVLSHEDSSVISHVWFSLCAPNSFSMATLQNLASGEIMACFIVGIEFIASAMEVSHRYDQDQPLFDQNLVPKPLKGQ